MLPRIPAWCLLRLVAVINIKRALRLLDASTGVLGTGGIRAMVSRCYPRFGAIPLPTGGQSGARPRSGALALLLFLGGMELCYVLLGL